MQFEWDAGKAARNLRKHGVSFKEAISALADPLGLTYEDPDHSNDETREITIGHTSGQRLLFVSHSRRLGRIRIISARRATKAEQRQYEEGD